ncbi:hypothetical protein [Chryseobacterium sp. GP-SGM7]|uniref:hypothetical protein n=1 Tax=Chryseobacterium sp. GP-SGM7 TaxID=3411323 RepID=UPI003B955248
MKALNILLILFFVLNCKQAEKQIEIEKKLSTISKIPQNSILKIKGDFVVFLRPDSLKFNSMINEEGIYEADSDFGFGITSTTDSLSKNKKYKDIKVDVTEKRYVLIETSGKLIDRDTIDYGIIFSSAKKNYKISTFIHSYPYIQDIDDYFFKN